jgi:hypothetical protein
MQQPTAKTKDDGGSVQEIMMPEHHLIHSLPPPWPHPLAGLARIQEPDAKGQRRCRPGRSPGTRQGDVEGQDIREDWHSLQLSTRSVDDENPPHAPTHGPWDRMPIALASQHTIAFHPDDGDLNGLTIPGKKEKDEKLWGNGPKREVESTHVRGDTSDLYVSSAKACFSAHQQAEREKIAKQKSPNSRPDCAPGE